MNKISRIYLAGLLALSLAACGPAKERPRENLEKAAVPGDAIRLVILHPSTYPLRSLIKLREIGFLTPENLTVVGVYHEREKTDFQDSFDMVEEEGLDWIRFHRVSGDLHADNLFQSNPLSEEFADIFRECDGVIFFGGADIPPYLYGEPTELLTSIHTPYRHFLELSFAFHLLGGFQDPEFEPLLAERPGFPVLGICLGEQTLNTASGGSMVQDVWSELYQARSLEDAAALSRDNWHSSPYARLHPEIELLRYAFHPIRLAEDGFFVTELGFRPDETPYIVSAHHQAADVLGKDFRAVATSLDGRVVEAIHHRKFPHVLGLQFHPEFSLLYDPGKQYRVVPEDETTMCPLSFLKENPPSYTFHQAIWRWLGERLEAEHGRR
jgi:putative glutamine amidotransferase